MSTDNPNAVTNDDETQSQGNFEDFKREIAELTLDPDIQRTFTTSADAATEAAARVKLNQAASLLPDGWMSGSLGLDDLATQVEAGRLTNSAALLKLAEQAPSTASAPKPSPFLRTWRGNPICAAPVPCGIGGRPPAS